MTQFRIIGSILALALALWLAIYKAPTSCDYRLLISSFSCSSMSKIRFTLNTGTTIPWLGFGTGTALYGKDAANLVRLAIENGITHLDGAQMYNNEDTLGAGIKASGKPRSDLFVTTKLKNLAPGESVKDSLKASLARLGLDYVDLFLIHDPTPATKEGKLAEWWEGMEEVHKEGLAKNIGVSNFKVEDLKIVLDTGKIIPAANQVALSHFHLRYVD